MTNSIIPISIAVVLLLSCKKEPSAAECQSKYDSVRASYQVSVADLSANAQALPPGEYERRLDQIKQNANAKGRAVSEEGCCCWTSI